MRKWMIAGLVVLLVVIVATVVALFSLNTLIDRNKDYIVAQVRAAVGRDITVGDIGVSLWGGGVRLKQFSVADDPAFSREAFVRAEDLQVNLKLPALLRKQLEVSKVILHRPVINIIKDGQGRFNFSSMGRQKVEKKAEEEKNKERQEKGPPPALLISLIEVDRGQIHYVDKSAGLDLNANRIALQLNDISFDRPIDVDLSAAVLGAEKQNLNVKARVGPLGEKPEAAQFPVEGDLNLDAVPLANLEKTFPQVKQRYPQGLELAGAIGAKMHFAGEVGQNALPQITGTLDINAVSARVPQLAQAISDVTAKINFTGKSAELPETAFRIGKSQVHLAAKLASFAPVNLTYRLTSPELALADLRPPSAQQKKPDILKNLASEGTVLVKNGALTYRGIIGSPTGTIADADYTNLQTTVSFVNHIATIESLSVAAFGGSLTAKGNYDMRESTPRFVANTTVKQMDLTQIFRSLLPTAPQNIRGLVNMDVDLSGAGKDWNTIQNALKGKTRAEVVDGALVDVNLADSVLSGVIGMPGLANLVPGEVKDKYPSVFRSKDTEFKQLKGSALIADGKARTDDLVVSAAEFEIQGKGWYAFDHSVDFRALLLLSPKLSQDIIGRARQAKGLADKQGRMQIPFDLSGKLPGAKPKPDLGYIAQAMGKGAAEQGLERLFQKTPGGRSERPPAQEQKSPGSQEKKKPNPKDEIMRGLQQYFGR